MDKKIEIIKNILQQKLEEIDNFVFPDDYEISNNFNKRKIFAEFLRKICFFVDFIYQQEELRGQLVSILNEYDDLENKPEIKKLKTANGKLLKKIAKEFEGWKIKEKLAQFLESEKLINPLIQSAGGEPFIHCSKFATMVLNADLNDCSIDSARIIKSQFDDLANNLNDPQLDSKLKNSNKTLWSNICKLEFLLDYDPSFCSMESFKEIDNIYQHEYPYGKEYLAKDILEKFFVSKRETLKIHARKVYQELLNRLDERICKHTVIERVKNYFELFVERNEVVGEKILQKEAEKIIFFERYYPISESQLKKGRLDTLISGNESSMLVEYKFVSEKDSQLDVGNKMRAALNEIDSYLPQIAGFPQLQKEVYILIFCSGKRLNIESAKKVGKFPYILHNGYVCYFVPINMVNISASKLNSQVVIEVDLERFLNKKNEKEVA